jgi:hypothetical protein
MINKAKESAHVRKARRKLRQQIADENKKINKKALEQMSINIKRWISRHSGERISLLSKTFTLFDENQHPAPAQDQYINELSKSIMGGVIPSEEAVKKQAEEVVEAQVAPVADSEIKPLEGRVTF